MKLKDLIGRKIVDILVALEQEVYGLDKAECYLVLDNNFSVGIPFGIDDEEVWRREPDKSAVSLFREKKWWQTKEKNILPLKNSTIVDIISYPESSEKSFFRLDNGNVITEVTVAPHGTGHAGLWRYSSFKEVQDKYGDRYTSLTNWKGSA
jgi:hypothetical protein